MGRPCKSAKLLTECSQTKDEIEQRIQIEEALKGESQLIPPEYLNEKQKALYVFIADELKEAEILCGLDTYILETCVIAIDRLQTIETIMNTNLDWVSNGKLMNVKDKYTKDLYRCCNELSLSPQSRAKLANINLQHKEDKNDPVVNLLNGNNDKV